MEMGVLMVYLQKKINNYIVWNDEKYYLKYQKSKGPWNLIMNFLVDY
jgi:hypothetical protein